MPEVGNFLFTQLSADALTDGRLFDGLSAGEFIDMHGRAVKFAPGELPTYLSNTLAAIAATKAESGEIVGLPIDARDHENGDGSGWIVGAELEGTRIRLKPLWTDLGADLIKRGIRRFFSATVDTMNKVILGGTLTNWPATRDPQGKVMLRPIELAQAPGTFQLAAAGDSENSLNDLLEDVYDAWRAQYEPDPLPYCYIVEAFSDHVIVKLDDELFSVAYTRAADDTVTFAPKAEWVAVKQTYVEAAMARLRKFKASIEHALAGNKPETAAPAATQNAGDDDMPKFAEMTAAEKLELAQLVAAEQAKLAPKIDPAPATNGAPPADLAAFLGGIAPLNEDGKRQLTDYMARQAELAQEQARLAFQAQMAQIQRENAVTELCQRVTGGSDDAPRGLKNVDAAVLKAHLLALPADEALYFGNLLGSIVKDGLVPFAELGHSRKMTGSTELPKEYAASLDKGEIALADLSSPLLGLGDLAQYDLSKWQPAK